MPQDIDRADPGRNRLRSVQAMVLFVVTFGSTVAIGALFFLASTLQSEIDRFAAANSDAAQWTLAQTEVELMALRGTLPDASATQPANLAEVRKRFDILYSRIKLIAGSRQFADLRQKPKAKESLSQLQGFLDRTTPLIDGPDDALIPALAAMAQELDQLRDVTRQFSLVGVKHFSLVSDQSRESVASLLSRIGFLILGLVLALAAGIVILVLLNRRSTRAERLVADARNRLQEVIATSLDGIIVADIKGRVIEYNGSAEAVFGFARAEAVGRYLSDLIIPDHLRGAHVAGMQRYRQTGVRHVLGKGLVRLEAQRKNGEVFPVEMSLSSAKSGQDEIFVAFLRDISDRVATEQELIHARDRAVLGEKAKAQLLAVMSHEMRTPLNGIIGTIELLQDGRLDDSQKRLVAAMQTSAGLLLHHVNGVLSMSRAEAGQLDLQNQEVDPAALLQEIVDSQRPVIEAGGNRILCETSAAPARIWVDPLRLRQVILNLVGNANKFTRAGEIRVECEGLARGQEVEFRVIDTGIGIAEEHLEQIFEEFQTLDSSFSRRAEGTGLGLAISRKLVEAMGGEISVESEPGQGSLFWLRLPIGAPAAAGAADAPGLAQPSLALANAGAGGMNILLIEDNAINRLVAREMLFKAGHSVTEAVDGSDGVAAAEARAFDLILMDISMPGMDGLAATRAIRQGQGPNRQAPIIALTAHTLPEDRARFHAAGLDDVLIKPLTSASLSRTLSRIGESEDKTAQAPDPGLAAQLRTMAEQVGTADLHRLLQRFVAEGDALAARISAADWPERPAAERIAEVHRLAGSAAVFGASGLAGLLRDAETALRSDSADRPGFAANFAAIWAQTRGTMEEAIAQGASQG